jgi:hypothetical protein
VSWSQILFGGLLVAVLVGLAGYYAWVQVLTLRSLRIPPGPPPVEARYERAKACRRLIGSVLMLILAVQLGVALVFLEEPAQQEGDRRVAEVEQAKAQGEEPPTRSPEQRWFVRVYTVHWLIFLIVLLALIVLAGLDRWATRRFGLHQLQQLQADRRAMIERQLDQLRADRIGAG